MSEHLDLGKGRKRRLQHIRWKHSEIVSALCMGLVILLLNILLAYWLAVDPLN